MTNQLKYREFCKKEKNIPIFSKDWWLDSVCGEDWDVVLYEKDNQILGSMPFLKSKKIIFNIVSMPMLTQTFGLYLKYPANQRYYKKLSWEKKVMTELIEQLPRFDYFIQNFHYSITNWLPFYWKGFNQTTRYTYVIEDLSDLDDFLKNSVVKQSRQMFNKAAKVVDIVESQDPKAFYNMVEMTFKRQGLNVPYTYDFFKKLDDSCVAHDARKILFAIDKETGQPHVALYIVYDEKRIYLLASGADPDLRNSGAENLLEWEAIKFAASEGKIVDFEGSMIENIEKHARSLGFVQKPYLQISKTNSKILKTILFLRDLKK